MNPNETSCHSNEGDWYGSTMMSASSWHTGGAQICLADGSVKFISETIDYATWVRLGARNDGQVIGEYRDLAATCFGPGRSVAGHSGFFFDFPVRFGRFGVIA
jgi:prepilin-type processing-associated H-X9-DG protein